MMLAETMTRSVKIDLARQFSPEPFGRYPSHGPASGERFRKEFLERALLAGDDVIVDIDGVTGLSSSFLDEAFAGLVRQRVVTLEQFRARVHIKSDTDPSYIDDVLEYVSEAAASR